MSSPATVSTEPSSTTEPSTEANGTKATKRELVSIAVNACPEGWTGKVTKTDKRYGDGEHKFSISVAIPSNEEDATKLYGVSLEDLVIAGVVQKWYGARDVDNVLAENLKNGVGASDAGLLATVTATARAQRFAPKPAGAAATATKAKAAKFDALEQQAAGLGLTTEQLIALAKAKLDADAASKQS